MNKYWPIVEAVAGLSKDPSTKVGAILLDEDGRIVSTGYNGFPRGDPDTPEDYADRPLKLRKVVHAECNCICNAAALGVPTKGTIMMVYGLTPCASCAGVIVNAGVKDVLVYVPSKTVIKPEWFDEWEITTSVFSAAGVLYLSKVGKVARIPSCLNS